MTEAFITEVMINQPQMLSSMTHSTERGIRVGMERGIRAGMQMSIVKVCKFSKS